MKLYVAIILSIIFCFSCITKRTETVDDKNIERAVELEKSILQDSTLKKEPVSTDSISHQIPISKSKDDFKKNKTKVNSIPSQVQIQEIEMVKEERKEPLVIKNIEWSNEELILTYKKTVYPKPGVGCSSSEEEMTLRIPISKPAEKIVLNSEQLRNSQLKYSYSGGLYGENSLDLPPSGQITLSPLKSGQWEVDIDITFPIEKMGGFDQEKADKEFKISDIFN